MSLFRKSRGSGKEAAKSAMLQADERIMSGLEGEEKLAAGLVWDLQLDQRTPAWMVVTDSQIAWTWLARSNAVMAAAFRLVHAAYTSDQPPGFALVTKDPALDIDIPENPEGEVVARFELPPTPAGHALFRIVMMGVEKHSPNYSAQLAPEERVRRIEAIQRVPVATLDNCPLCGKPLTVKTEHAIQCSRCVLLVTDPGLEPVAEDRDGVVVLVGSKPWLPVLITDLDRGLENRTRAWVTRPDGAQIRALFVPDHLTTP